MFWKGCDEQIVTLIVKLCVEETTCEVKSASEGKEWEIF